MPVFLFLVVFTKFDCQVFFSRFFFPSTQCFDIFSLLTLCSPSTSITSLTLSSQNSFAQSKLEKTTVFLYSCKAVFGERKNAYCISFHLRLPSSFVEYSSDRKRPSGGKRFFRLRIRGRLCLGREEFSFMVKTTCVQRSVPVSPTPIFHLLKRTKNTSRQRMSREKTVTVGKTSHSHKRNINFLLMLSAFIPFLIYSPTRWLVKLLKNAWKKEYSMIRGWDCWWTLSWRDMHSHSIPISNCLSSGAHSCNESFN